MTKSVHTHRKKDRVCVLHTSVGDLVIRSNPNISQVKAFVTEQQRRYVAGEPAGHNPALPAFQILAAQFVDSEVGLENPKEIDLTDVLSPAGKK